MRNEAGPATKSGAFRAARHAPRFREALAELVEITAPPPAPASQTPRELAARFVERVAARLDAELIYARVPCATPLEIAWAKGELSADATHQLGAALDEARAAAAADGPIRLPDPSGAAELLWADVLTLDIGTGGIAACAARRPSFPTQEERLLFRALVNQTTVALRYASAIASAHDIEVRLDAALATVTDCLAVIDHAGRVLYVNRAVEQVLGKPRERILGQDLWTVVPGLRGTRFEEEYRRAMRDGVTIDIEAYDPPRERWWSVRGYPSSYGLTLCLRDMTAKKERDLLHAMLEASHAVATLELPELIEKIGFCFRTHLRWDWELTCVFLHDATRGVLRLHQLAQPKLPLIVDFADELPLDSPIVGRNYASGGALAINSVAEWATYRSPLVDAVLAAGLRSMGAVPLVSRGQRIGALAACSTKEGAFESEAVELLRAIAEVIAPAIENALARQELSEIKERLAVENRYLTAEVNSSFGEIIGESAALKRVLARVETVATTDATVLITGPTGTGKEFVARAIHRLSPRKDHTFVKLNCAAVPTGLLDSELFGHEKGAFTSAVAQRIGRFELANGGTLFLDEIGELPLELQPKLLRVLQERELERVGGTRTIKVDVRVVAATNRDLRKMMAAGAFRADLFYRLSVFPVELPALRERREDIPLLVRHFVQRAARRLGKKIDSIPAASLEALVQYDWPGNVRELENVIERSAILSRSAVLDVPVSEFHSTAPGPNDSALKTPPPVTQPLAEVERRAILAALDASDWIVGGPSGAAARLGLSRTTLQARMRKHGLRRPSSAE